MSLDWTSPIYYCELTKVFAADKSVRSPIIFIHGFPDSPQMWQRYYTAAEQSSPWLAGRDIYTLAFPNRQTRPVPLPSWRALRQGVLAKEVEAALDQVIAHSPTGQIIPIVHDLGATMTWQYVRQRGGQVSFEKLVALSVGSSFRYDVGEHGLNAFTWLYQVIYILPHLFRIRPLQRLLAYLLVWVAGYRSESKEDIWRDTYHYWDGWLWPLRLPFYLSGLLGHEPEFLGFSFPVLFIRSEIDRIASTAAFEQALRQRSDCEIVVLPHVTHWFPEQNSEQVLAYLRPFLAPQPATQLL